MGKTMQQLKAASPYSGVLTREQFLFYETRTTAKLLDEDDIHKSIEDLC